MGNRKGKQYNRKFHQDSILRLFFIFSATS
jgi:hypothetical protein